MSRFRFFHFDGEQKYKEMGTKSPIPPFNNETVVSAHHPSPKTNKYFFYGNCQTGYNKEHFLQECIPSFPNLSDITPPGQLLYYQLPGNCGLDGRKQNTVVIVVLSSPPSIYNIERTSFVSHVFCFHIFLPSFSSQNIHVVNNCENNTQNNTKSVTFGSMARCAF